MGIRRIIYTLFLIFFLSFNMLDAQILPYFEQESFFHPPQLFSFELLPKTSFSEQINAALNELEPRIGSEILYRISRTDWDPDSLNLYNRLGQIKSLKNILYFSESNQEERIMVKDAYRIKNPNFKKTPLDDTKFTRIPAKNTLYVLLNLTNYGKASYKVDYYYDGSVFLISLINQDKIRYKNFFSFADKEYLHFYFLVIPEEKDITVYGSASFFNKSMRASNKFIPFERLTISLKNRLRALMQWFIQP